jgi:2-amino-4-deoxychorismate synthase
MHRHRVGFYNTFAARSAADHLDSDRVPSRIEISRGPDTGEVLGLRGAHFRSVQFHPESVLTESGPQILSELLTPLMAGAPVAASA